MGMYILKALFIDMSAECRRNPPFELQLRQLMGYFDRGPFSEITEKISERQWKSEAKHRHCLDF